MTSCLPNSSATSPGRGEVPSPWVLPEDGIVDPIAIEIAANGARPVALTHTERVLAAARILAAGGGVNIIAARLHVSGSTARSLVHRAGDLGDPGEVWTAPEVA